MSDLYPNMPEESLSRWATEHSLDDFLKIPARTLQAHSPSIDPSWLWQYRQSSTPISELISAPTQTEGSSEGVPIAYQLAAIQLLLHYHQEKQQALQEEEDIIALLPPVNPTILILFRQLQEVRQVLRTEGTIPRSLSQRSGARFWLEQDPIRFVYKEERQAWCAQGSWPEVQIHIHSQQLPTLSCSCSCEKNGRCPIGISAIDRSLEALIDPLEHRLQQNIAQLISPPSWENTINNLPLIRPLPKGELLWHIQYNKNRLLKLEPIWGVETQDGSISQHKTVSPGNILPQLSVKNQYFIKEFNNKDKRKLLELIYCFPSSFKLVHGKKTLSYYLFECTRLTIILKENMEHIFIYVQFGTHHLALSDFIVYYTSNHQNGYLTLFHPDRMEIFHISSDAQQLLQQLGRHVNYPKNTLPTLLKSLNNYNQTITIEIDSSVTIPVLSCEFEYVVHFSWNIILKEGTITIHVCNNIFNIDIPITSEEKQFFHIQNGNLFYIQRDQSHEAHIIQSFYSSLPEHTNPYSLSADELLIGLEWAKDFGLKTSCMSHESWHLLSRLEQIQCHLHYLDPSFEMQGFAWIDQTQLPLQNILSMVRQNQIVSEFSAQLIIINQFLLDRLLVLADTLQPTQQGLQIHPVHIPSLQQILNNGIQIDSDSKWDFYYQQWRDSSKVNRSLQYFNGTLRPYQRNGLDWLQSLKSWAPGAFLADEMGLGKTIQTIALLSNHIGEGPFLVVCPNSVLNNWSREILKFCPQLTPLVYHGENRHTQLSAVSDPSNLVVITSYSTLRVDQEIIGTQKYAIMILDEAQYLKNAQTKRHKAIQKIERDWTLALSGTPVENSLLDVWSIFKCIHPSILGSKRIFQHRFIQVNEEEKEGRRHSLHKLIQPFFLRRSKHSVLKELPPKIDIRIDIDLTPPERRLYQKYHKAIQSRINPSDPQLRFQILQVLMKLRQLACHPKLIDPYDETPSSKLERCLELAEELYCCGKSILIFSQFVQFLNLLKQRIEEKGYAYSYLDGQSTRASREANISEFQDQKTQIFLISLRAGGIGLNLTQATEIILLDPWWNPAIEDQAISRAHRMGQKEPVSIYRMVSRNTIESQVLQLHTEKRMMMSEILSESQPNFDISLLLDILQQSNPQN